MVAFAGHPLIVGDRVVGVLALFAQPGALAGAALEEVVAAARALDMDEVRRELARAEGGVTPGA